MEWIVAAIVVLVSGGLIALAAARRARLAGFLGPASAVLGCGLMLGQALEVLLRGDILTMRRPWPVPLGSICLTLDPLAAWFALLIALIGGVSAVYGGQYLRGHGDPRRAGRSWFFYNLLLASMLVVVLARNGVLFLIAWEIMSLASWFLVMFDSEDESVRRAGWTYLVATHLATAFLMAMFALLGRASGTLDFQGFSATGPTAGVVFLLALVGFGTKAGLIPLHVWLPEAHPAAPSHVSAVMSGVMIKMGIYGLLRVLTILGPPEPWWGWTLLAAGAVSGILGVLFALAQHDIKRLLAYSSVENIGLITVGLGVGLLGVAAGSPTVAALGLAGGLLHVGNHAVFKSLLFLGAGAVAHATGTREIDRLGGLLKRMPATGLAFLAGAAAISGLPPLNGFVSELLIYLGVFSGATDPGRPAVLSWALLSILAIGTLTLVGGLAAACFTKAFGVIFLGEPRTTQAAEAHEAGLAMRVPMLILAGACVVLAGLGPWLPSLLRPALQGLLATLPAPAVDAALGFGAGVLSWVAGVSVVLLLLIVGLIVLRHRLLAGRTVGQAGTWDCGYAGPTARMQYTASSFAAPLLKVFRIVVYGRTEIRTPEGLFPDRASLRSHVPDVFSEWLFRPVFLGVARAAASLRWFQQGRIQLYVLYIAVTLLVLLIWKLG